MVYFSVNYVLRTVKVMDFENKNKICDLALKISQSSYEWDAKQSEWDAKQMLK